MILGQRDGFVKVLSDAKSGEILGIHIFGPQATEQISEAALAMRMKATVSGISSTIHAHPTLSEAVGETALDAEGAVVHMPRKP